MVAPGEHAWFLLGGMRGFFWGHAWFFPGGGVWFFPGGMHDFSGGACVVFSRGHARFFSGERAWFFLGGMHRIRRDTVNERVACILLECILVRCIILVLELAMLLLSVHYEPLRPVHMERFFLTVTAFFNQIAV